MTTLLEPLIASASEAIAGSPPHFNTKISASLVAIIQSAVDGVIVVDATRRIILANHKAEQMFGYPEKQLLEKSIDLLLLSRVSAEQRRKLERLTNNRTNGRRTRVGLRALRANGDEFPLNAYLSRITVKGETFFVVVLQDQAKHSNGERKLRALKPSELRKLAVSAQQTNEAEKKRFSKELYDDIGQRLSVLKLDLDWLENSLVKEGNALPERVAQMQGLLDNVITMTKSMASTLRPPLLDDFGLMPAVKWMAENFQKRTSIKCKVVDHGVYEMLPEPIKSAVFRVIQESLLNIERHAQAQNVSITVGQSERHLDLLITDDGIGMAWNSQNKPGCYGLIAMQERIFILGGTITIRNMEPQGVLIYASIPIDVVPSSIADTYDSYSHRR